MYGCNFYNQYMYLQCPLVNIYESIHKNKQTDLTSVASSNQDVLLLADIAISSFLPMIAVHIRVHTFQNPITIHAPL